MPMYLMDYHTHSDRSPDGYDRIIKLAGAGVAEGFSELAVTDHYDLDAEDGSEGTAEYDADGARAQLDEANARFGDTIRIKWGVELGEGVHAPDRAQKVLSSVPFDFVIGSVHNLRGLADFYCMKYNEAQDCYKSLDLYMDELTELAGQGFFDVLGHLSYPLRYMVGRDGYKVDFRRYEERLRVLFKTLAQTGRGIEINTSGLRGKLKETMPPLWCLRLFKECGGEIVTVGSDAHRAKDVGKGVREGYAMLLASGFGAVASFEQRKPMFHKI
jgi:histidinol-phosphatase (PHP family)